MIAILKLCRVEYLAFGYVSLLAAFAQAGESLPFFQTAPPPYLRHIDAASNADADVYEVLEQ